MFLHLTFGLFSTLLFFSCTVEKVESTLLHKEPSTLYEELPIGDSLMMIRIFESELYKSYARRLESNNYVKLVVWVPPGRSVHTDSMYHFQIAANSAERLQGLENIYVSKKTGYVYRLDMLSDSLLFLPEF